MFSIGVAKPESKTAGLINKNEPNTACCCVLESDEMNKPTPTIAKMKINMLK